MSFSPYIKRCAKLVLALAAVLTAGVAFADAPSDQAAQGAETYSQFCITCHGDRGQGLAEWRFAWPKERQNCSMPKCHGLAHPPDGFYLPNNYAPAIIGQGTLARFATAYDLYQYISERMPYQEPGRLSADEYWALTAYLLDQHGRLAQDTPLNPETARLITLREQGVQSEQAPQSSEARSTTSSGIAPGHPTTAPESDNRPIIIGGILGGIVLLFLVGAGVFAVRRAQRS